MIFQSFILDNLVSLCMKIMNSVVVVGLYYGFLSTFSIGPSYLFLLRARVMQEGTEKKLSATAGFITGQLIMFISIYYAPLHLALGRPHIITVIALPYLLFHFFGNNQKNFLNYGYKNQNSIRNFSIQRIFFNNLIFQLFNPLVFPSSILVRLVNIYLFRCNKKIIFLTSGFVGWVIGHIFFMKWIELTSVWIQQKNFIHDKVPIRSTIISEFKISMSQIFIVFLFITCLYYLGRTPFPFFIKKRSEIQESSKMEKKKMDVERTSETTGTKQEKKISTEKDAYSYLFFEKDQNSYKINENEEKKISVFQKYLVTIFFDFKRWKRPLRYIKNARFENIVRNEISQFFFYTCKSDGKEKIFFTYPPNLSTFIKMMEKKIDLFTPEKNFYDKLSNYWNSRNEEKKKKLRNEFLNRAEVLDKEFLPLDIVEKRIRLCNEETQTKNLPKIYDPFLNGPCRGRIQNCLLSSMKTETYKKNDICINKIDALLINSKKNNPEFKQKIDTFDKKSLLIEIFFFFFLIQKFSDKSVSSLNFEGLVLFPEYEQVKVNSEKKKIKLLFDAIRTDLNEKRIVKKKKCIGIKEMRKEVPRWSYKLIDELEQLEVKNEEEKYGIRSRKAKRVVIFTFTNQNNDTYRYTRDTNNTDKNGELALIRYAQQPDFRRDIIKGSIRAQRRKTITWKLFQKSLHSPLFLDKIEKPSFFSFLKNFEPMRQIIFMFKNWMRTKVESLNSDYTEENKKESEEGGEKKKKEKEEKRRIEIGEAWDSIIFAQVIRGYLLITQSILRKYIILPSLIITKNIVRMLLFQFPEWSEDFRDWKKEMYIKCTYNGVQLSETEFPKKWLIDGIQIKIIFPFRLKPWHRSKLRSTEKDTMKKKDEKKRGDFCFLTILGMEVEFPFSSFPRNQFYFFHPIFKKLNKKIKKWKNNFFIVLNILNQRTKLFLNLFKEGAKWIIKRIQFLNEKIKQLPTLFLLRFKNLYGLSESQKDSTISNKIPMIYESPIRIQSVNWTTCSLKKKKIKDLNAERNTIIKKIKKMRKEKGVFSSEINISSNKKSYYAKRFELKKIIWEIFKKRNPLLARKSHHYFLKSLMERVYLNIFLCIIYIPKIDVQLFLESRTRNRSEKEPIYYNETKEDRTDKTNQSLIHFISILKKYSHIRTKNSQNSCDVSSLSQAYVFFKLSETQVINIYKLRSAFEDHGKSFFLKNEIRDFFFGIQRISYSKLRQKKPRNSVMNQWKNWLLKGHYQYELSQRRWSRLVPQKWRNRIHERRVSQKKDFKKRDSYEKTRLVLYKNQQLDSLKKKQYEYDLFSYKSINYADKKHSYIYGYGSPFQSNKNQAISYNYNTCKQKIFDLTSDISIKNYIAEDAIIDMEKNLDRKYFDWMGMNEELLNRSISNREFMFLSKFLIFLNAYMSNPWIIPIQLLFFDYNFNINNINQNVSANKNITGRKKIIDIFRSSKKKKKLEFELKTRNQAKAEYTGRVDFESPLSTQEKDIEEDYTGLDRKEDINKPQYNSKIEEELNFLLKRFFIFQLNWKGSLNQRVMNNIKIYCLLIRLKNLKEIAITSIQRGELSLDIMMIHNQKDLTLTELTKNKKLINEGIFIIEPVRLSRENDEKFFMYQTIGLSLIHKSKRQINQRYPEKSHVDKKKLYKSTPRTRDQKITEKKETNHYDLFVPEFLFSARRRREFRILMSFNSKNRDSVHRKTTFYNKNKGTNCCKILAENKDLDREKKKQMNFYFFLWPNFRLEDLACMNRYWFDTYNGSRFSIVRIHMYP
uniref:Protein TIC 214 n=1 Tax=Dalbergia millettii var. mimosoides TaxID=3085985 RepID=A0A8K1BDT8_9FABA|nr:Ycf1 [Dalbergia millettii var. mimosoides]QXU57976.1 Ycf1 [Dalbergia millettii var. mimosoides]